MQEHDKPDFFTRLNGIQDVFGKPKLTAAAAQMWWDAVRDLDHNDVFTVLSYWCQTNSKPPAPADVWRIANDNRTHRLEDRAATEARSNRQPIEQAWGGATPTGRKFLRLMQETISKPRRNASLTDIVAAKDGKGEYVPYYTRKIAEKLRAARINP